MQTPQMTQGNQLRRQFGQTQLAQIEKAGPALGFPVDELSGDALAVEILRHAGNFTGKSDRRDGFTGALGLYVVSRRSGRPSMASQYPIERDRGTKDSRQQLAVLAGEMAARVSGQAPEERRS